MRGQPPNIRISEIPSLLQGKTVEAAKNIITADARPFRVEKRDGGYVKYLVAAPPGCVMVAVDNGVVTSAYYKE